MTSVLPFPIAGSISLSARKLANQKKNLSKILFPNEQSPQ